MSWHHIVIAVAMLLVGCSKIPENQLQGWVEAEFIFVSPDEAGRVDTLGVREGDTVNKGAPLFTVDPDLQQADVLAAEAGLANAQQAYGRAKTLLQSAAGTQRALDEADAALRSAQARLNSERTRLNRRRMVSPETGTVQEVYYRPGETVPAGRAVVSILPPENLKIRFFARQGKLQSIKIGDVVAVSCDGCESNLNARVSFISKSAEFTPPVIYTLEERAKLVFLIEARPARPDKFRVGQPVTVTLPETAQ
jgi:HlyD family secretion protein